MSEKIRGIVLNVRKYNDRNNIITLYTRERGRLAFISPAGSGKASNARRARLQPLAVVETELNYKAGAELQRLGSVTPSEIWTDIYFHPAKRAISLFISEFLYYLLNATMPDPSLYDFLIDSLRLLDSMDNGINDYHLVFLISLLPYSGIQPDTSGAREGYVFDFSAGGFLPEFEAKGPVIASPDADAIPVISRLNFSNMKCLRLTAANRRQILYGILNYYSYHYPGLGKLKSIDVLRDLFS